MPRGSQTGGGVVLSVVCEKPAQTIELRAQPRDQRCGQHRGAVLVALASEDQHAVPIEVEALHA